MTESLVRRDWIVAAVGGGIVSGVTLAAFAAFDATRAGLPVSAFYRLLSAAVGGDAFGASGAAVPVGILVLFATTILWGFGYAYGAGKQPQLVTRPLISGIGFGVVVWVVTQMAVIGMHQNGYLTSYKPTFAGLDRDMLALVAFFGVPLAFTVSRLLRAR